MNNLIEIGTKFYIEAEALILKIEGRLDRNKGAFFKDSTEDWKLTPNFYYGGSVEFSDCPYYHLYITTFDAIKDGDFFIHPDGFVMKANSQSDHRHYKCPKVIACTDLSLGLPLPNFNFIKYYADSYVTGSGLTTVLVEVEKSINEEGRTAIRMCDDAGKEFSKELSNSCYDFKIKTKENIIFIEDKNINKNKVWSTAEVENKLLDMVIDISKHLLLDKKFTDFPHQEWITENIKNN